MLPFNTNVIVHGVVVNSIFEKLENYLQERLKQTVRAESWEEANELPLYLATMFRYAKIKLLGNTCLLLLADEEDEVGPAKIAKHCMNVQSTTGLPCILVRETMTNYQRKNLVSLGVPFIVPEKHLYLPNLGIDFKESYTTQVKKTTNHTLSPATRLVILHILVHGPMKEVTPSLLAEQLGYTRMTMTRALDELRSAEIGTLTRRGKYRLWEFEGSRKDLWEQVKDFLTSPVKKKLWIGGSLDFDKVVAGLSALDHYSMIAGPSLPIYAVGRREWKHRLVKQAQILPYPDQAIFQLEIWEFDPKVLSSDAYADPFSIYLSLCDLQDERVEMALEDMMEAIKW